MRFYYHYPETTGTEGDMVEPGPVHEVAAAAATVDKLSGGRLILGLGAGYQKAEFFALGVDIQEHNILFDEALDVLPLHWSGEPFSYQGRHFSARDVIARPRPVQNPIPIWIGGNSKLSRRRVAERAQGWMPMLGPPELSVTARTVAISSLPQLAGMIGEVRDAADAAGRTGPIDVMYSYQDPSIGSPASEPDRHREALAAAEKAGATCVLVTSQTREPSVRALHDRLLRRGLPRWFPGRADRRRSGSRAHRHRRAADPAQEAARARPGGSQPPARRQPRVRHRTVGEWRGMRRPVRGTPAGRALPVRGRPAGRGLRQGTARRT